MRYNTTTNHLTNIGGPNGNTLGYDGAGDVVWIRMSPSIVNNLAYDGEGRFFDEYIPAQGNYVQAEYFYNALGYRVERYNPTVGWESIYNDPWGNEAEVVNGASQEIYLPPVAGRHYAMYIAGDTFFTHANGLGSTGMLTNHAGNAQQEVLYNPFGSDWTSAGSSPTGYYLDARFAGMQPWDPMGPETYCDFTPNRVYGGLWLSRWLSPDPLAGDITNPQSLNRYAYVGNNPTSFIDPKGSSPSQQGCRPGTPNCKTPPPCYGMVCADQYYGGSFFEGFSSTSEAICVKNGIAGYCNQGALASFYANAGDEFDAIAQGNGFSYTPAGQLQIDSSGRSSTGTGSASFDPGQWMQAEGFVDSGILGKYAPVTGYGTTKIFNGAQSAAFGTFAESLKPTDTSGSNFLSSIYIGSTLAPAFNWYRERHSFCK